MAKNPRRSFEVVFQAVELMAPTTRFDETDLLTDRRTLRGFFDFCTGRGIAQSNFRVNLYLVQDTLIIERSARAPSTFLNQSDGSSFVKSFKKAVTQLPRGLTDTSSHQRVIKYDFGGLKCAVRFDVDVS